MAAGEALAAGGGAGVEHVHARLRARGDDRAARGLVLDVEQALGIAWKEVGAACSIEDELALQAACVRLKSCGAEPLRKLLRACAEGVSLQIEWRFGVIAAQDSLRALVAPELYQLAHLPERMAVPCGKILRRAGARYLRAARPCFPRRGEGRS